eukprot:236209-Pleurochrysis_carterae.AAC.2
MRASATHGRDVQAGRRAVRDSPPHVLPRVVDGLRGRRVGDHVHLLARRAVGRHARRRRAIEHLLHLCVAQPGTSADKPEATASPPPPPPPSSHTHAIVPPPPDGSSNSFDGMLTPAECD